MLRDQKSTAPSLQLKSSYGEPNRSVARGLIALTTLLSCLLAAPVDELHAQDQPNIIYIFVDDLSSGMVGFTNPNTPVLTPNIDALAAAGLQFTQAYANTICSPSRGSLHTGYHNGHAINDRNVINFRAEDIMPGEMIKEAGYATAVYGKWGFGSTTGTHTGTSGVDTLRLNPVIPNNNTDTLPTTHGYDDFVGYLNHVQAHRFFIDPLWQSDFSSPNTMSHFVTGNNAGDNVTNTFEAYTDDIHTREAMNFITTSTLTSTPFMIQMHYNSPHPPFDPGEQLTFNFDGTPRIWDQDYQGLGLTVKQRQLAAMITRLDEHIGALVAHLSDPNQDGDESDSILENTVVMFTSDNGGEPTDTLSVEDWNELGGNHFYGVGLRGGKRDLFEGGVRVPCFAYWPGTIAPNQTTDEIIDLADFMPTVADLAGIDTPIGLDGVSYAGLLTGEGMFRRRSHFVWEHHERDGPDADSRDARWSVLKDNIKLIHFSNGSEDMYDLNVDPGETQPLDLSAFADVRAELQAIAVAEGVAESGTGHAARHVDWIGSDQDSTTSAGNWSNYNAAQELWVSVIANSLSSDSSIDFESTELLGVEVRGDSALQTIRVNQSNELAIGNELRVGANGRAHVDAGSLNSRRWLDIRSGGQLTGIGDLAGQLYNWGSIAPGLPTDLPAAVVDDSEGPAPGNFGGTVDPGVALSSSEPTENVIFDGITGSTIQTIIHSSANPGARGQNFEIGPAGSTAEIGGVTFQSRGAQSFGNGDEMTIVIFSGDNFTGIDQQTVSPAGLAMAPGITLLYQETFQLPLVVPNNNFLIFGFANPVSVNGGEPLGMMVFSNTEFQQSEGNNNGGGRLLYRAGSDITNAGTRDMRFSILGSATIVEPMVDVETITFNETGRLSLDGDFFHQPSGEIRLQVGGTDNSDPADYQFDQLVIDGMMANGGSLSVELLADYAPQDGDSIQLVQANNVVGDFSSIDVQGVPEGFEADVQISGGDVVLTLTASTFVLGDFDMDGDVDLVDLDQYNGNIGSPAVGALAALDLNGNGEVDAGDFETHYGTLVETSNGNIGTAAGDINLDGQVNILADAFALIANLGSSVNSWSQGDLNGDGTVTVLEDAFLLIANLGFNNG